MKISKALAVKFASEWQGTPDWESMRDWLDSRTGGELDCFRLDTLTDWTLAAVSA